MKLRVTQKGVFVPSEKGDAELEIGKVITLKGVKSIPASLVNKVEVVEEEPTEDKEPVTNPAPAASAKTDDKK